MHTEWVDNGATQPNVLSMESEDKTLKEQQLAIAENKIKLLILAGNAMSYELQDTDPDVKFETIKVWKQAIRS